MIGNLVLLALSLSTTLAWAGDWFSKEASHGNRVKLLPTGEETHKARIEVIEGAQRSIYVSAFSFSIDASTDEIFSALCRKARSGVEVRVLADSSGSSGLHKLEKKLLGCGIHLMFYNPRHGKIIHDKARLSLWGFNHSLNIIHEKLLIADGESMVMGGSNFGDIYKNASRDNERPHEYHDLNLRIDGPAACIYQRTYAQNWANSVRKDLGRALRFKNRRKKRLAHIYGPDRFIECEGIRRGNTRLIPIHANPMFSKERPIMERYRKAFAASEREILLIAPYFQPTEEMIGLLKEARRRNVEVKVLTNSFVSNDEEMSKFAMASLTKDLIAAGVKIYLWPKLSTLHRKAGVFDGKWAYVGSDNLSGRAQNYNSETVVFFAEERLVAQLREEIDLDLVGAELLTEEKRSEAFSSFSPWLRKSFKILRPLM